MIVYSVAGSIIISIWPSVGWASPGESSALTVPLPDAGPGSQAVTLSTVITDWSRDDLSPPWEVRVCLWEMWSWASSCHWGILSGLCHPGCHRQCVETQVLGCQEGGREMTQKNHRDSKTQEENSPGGSEEECKETQSTEDPLPVGPSP